VASNFDGGKERALSATMALRRTFISIGPSRLQYSEKASIAKIVGASLPPFTALSRQGGYAHTLKGYFYTNLGETLPPLLERMNGVWGVTEH
jgi:hypothetical protein